jgi:hypothetical protein
MVPEGSPYPHPPSSNLFLENKKWFQEPGLEVSVLHIIPIISHKLCTFFWVTEVVDLAEFNTIPNRFDVAAWAFQKNHLGYCEIHLFYPKPK